MAYYALIEMPVWQLGNEIGNEVYELIAKLPRCANYALGGQTREAAVPVTGTNAESFGRLHARDKNNFSVYSRESSFEVRNHFLAGDTVNYYLPDEIATISVKCLHVIEDLNQIIKGLASSLPKT